MHYCVPVARYKILNGRLLFLRHILRVIVVSLCLLSRVPCFLVVDYLLSTTYLTLVLTEL